MAFNQVDYINEYQKEYTRRIIVNLSRIYERDLIEHIEKQPNKQGYIKSLIKKDMEESRTAPK